jgi:phage/conjugal plasmid C-4 type zinc finger TraR family protein
MDGKTMQQLRDALLSRWRKIGAAGTDRDADVQNEIYSSSQAEIIDIAQTLEQIGRDTSLQEVERRELIAIERALAKMATGNFGFCEECGEEIPPKRLSVLPEARLCAGCQAYEERQNARTRLPGAAFR